MFVYVTRENGKVFGSEFYDRVFCGIDLFIFPSLEEYLASLVNQQQTEDINDPFKTLHQR
ncbi:hypothetical protein D3C86_2057570 [compost metagenome]